MQAFKNPISSIPEGRSSKKEIPTITPPVKPMAKLKNFEFFSFTIRPIAPPIIVERPAAVVISKAVKIFSAYLFELKPIHRLQLNCLKGNTGSRRVAEKCGYKLDGVMREVSFHRGEYCDLELFSLLRSECPSLKEVLLSGNIAEI